MPNDVGLQPLKGRHAVVTGAARGIGAEIARMLDRGSVHQCLRRRGHAMKADAGRALLHEGLKDVR